MAGNDADAYMKKITDALDGMFADLRKVAKQVADAAAAEEKAEAAREAAAGKAQADQRKQADAAAEAWRKRIMSLPPAPRMDPSQAVKIPDFITKYIDKNGVKLGDSLSISADVDFDLKKMQLKKFVPTVTLTF